MNKIWPVPQWITHYSYKEAPRSFGSKRSQGRIHAGCDLYAPVHSPVLAIAEGRVIESDHFYLGTFQITIDHGHLGVIRYGEMAAGNLPKVGERVAAGQQIGRIGNLGKGLHPMLHIEQFSGHANGRTTNMQNAPHFRRQDLIDCTPLLDHLRCFRGFKCN